MKTRKLLTLRKETVTNLENEQMTQVKGGIPYTRLDGSTCNTWYNCPTRPYNCVTLTCPTVSDRNY